MLQKCLRKAQQRSRGLYKRPATSPEEQERLKRELAAAKKARIERSRRKKKRRRLAKALEAAKRLTSPAASRRPKRTSRRLKSERRACQSDSEPVPKQCVHAQVPGVRSGGDLYSWRDYHKEIWVVVNQDSEFFKSLYQNATAHAERKPCLI